MQIDLSQTQWVQLNPLTPPNDAPVKEIFITMSYVNVSDATVKLFVDSGVNLGGNDSLFSTGGKNSALKKRDFS